MNLRELRVRSIRFKTSSAAPLLLSWNKPWCSRWLQFLAFTWAGSQVLPIQPWLLSHNVGHWWEIILLLFRWKQNLIAYVFFLCCVVPGAWGKAGWGVYVWKPCLLGSCPGLDISDHILSFPPWPVLNKLTVINSVCLWNSLGLPVLTSTVGMGLLWNLSCFTATVQLGSRRREHWAALVPPLGTW